MTRCLVSLTTLAVVAVLGGAVPSPAAALTADPPTWNLATLDSVRDVGAHLAVAVDPGTDTTFAVYYDSADEDLWLAYEVGSGGNCGASGSWQCTVLDQAGDVGMHPSLDVRSIAGGAELFVAYYDASNLALKFVKVTWHPPGSLFGIPVTIDTPGGSFELRGTHTSITVDADGVPHIAYRLIDLAGVDALRFARYLGVAAGNCGGGYWQCDSIVNGEGVGLDTSVALDAGGHPYVGSYDSSSGHPIVSSSFVPGMWTHSTITRGFDDTGRSSALLVTASGIRLAYFNADSQKLEYAYPVDSGTGNCGTDNGWQCNVIDDMHEDPGGRAVAMAADGSGLPIIAYQGYGPELRLARPAAAVSGVTPNCGPQVGLARTWYCETLDAGGIFSVEAAAVAVDTDGHGRPRVAYHELALFTPPEGAIKLAVEDPTVFADGFESGDLTGGWSSSSR